MIDSLSDDQIAHIVKLGEWRDEGHCFAVGFNGEVSIHPADKGTDHEADQQRKGAPRWEGSPGRQGPSGPRRSEAPAESARENGIANLRQCYFESMAEVREYYPNLRVIEVEEGIWVVTQIFPIGRDGPFFTVCVFLSDCKNFDPKAYGFQSDGRSGKAVGPRHTNFPDHSICAYSADDGVWSPGDSPLLLLGLYAEWLVCQLFLDLNNFWPGRQVGLDATYRHQEFKDAEWCDCGSQRRYGECHRAADAEEVRRLKRAAKYVPLPARSMPAAVVSFARSRWKKAPEAKDLHLHPFRDQDAAQADLIQRNFLRAVGHKRLDESAQSECNSLSLKARLLQGASAFRA